MTSQERASEMLTIWQLQRLAGIAPEDRRLPSPANDRDSFERDLAIVREIMGRM